jgi:excisionase family DNA binding protein
MTELAEQPHQRLIPVAEALRRLGVGRTSLYRLFAEGELMPLKVGARTFVAASDIDAFISRLITRSAASGK